jgi:hypothetical protein
MRDGEEKTPNKTDLRSCGRTKSSRWGTAQYSHDPKIKFSLRTNKSTTDPQRSPSSLPHLIGTKNYFLAHFYTRNVKIKLGSGKKPHQL